MITALAQQFSQHAGKYTGPENFLLAARTRTRQASTGHPMLSGLEKAARRCDRTFMEISDERLLKDCRSGDQSAWETLVHRYQRLIYAIARRAGLDRDQSAEVFQEVFATLLEKLDDITQPERLHAWLVTTARRKTWRLLSRESRWQKPHAEDEEDEDELAALPDNAALPDEALVRLEEQHRVRCALSALDERCRKLLTLLFYSPEPLPYSEVAARIGAKEGSIGPTRARCLQKLQRQLEN
jgi:RNA polymerase sigma factor (sigma-70 family)